MEWVAITSFLAALSGAWKSQIFVSSNDNKQRQAVSIAYLYTVQILYLLEFMIVILILFIRFVSYKEVS